jgi:hypothetical protein
MDMYQSHLQEDGTTSPPVTPDTPVPPGVVIPAVPDTAIAAPEAGHEDGEDG